MRTLQPIQQVKRLNLRLCYFSLWYRPCDAILSPRYHIASTSRGSKNHEASRQPSTDATVLLEQLSPRPKALQKLKASRSTHHKLKQVVAASKRAHRLPASWQSNSLPRLSAPSSKPRPFCFGLCWKLRCPY